MRKEKSLWGMFKAKRCGGESKLRTRDRDTERVRLSERETDRCT